jgi:shikimate kinase
MTWRHLVLVGLMGAGKTTVGKELARRLGWPFRDNDDQLTAIDGRTAREIAATDGLARLHALEAEALLRALADDGPAVIAAAASSIEDPACRAALATPRLAVVWLQGAPSTLAGRHDAGSHRPDLGQPAEPLLEAQVAHRDPLFASLQPIEINVDAATPRAVAAEILDHLGLGRGS